MIIDPPDAMKIETSKPVALWYYWAMCHSSRPIDSQGWANFAAKVQHFPRLYRIVVARINGESTKKSA